MDIDADVDAMEQKVVGLSHVHMAVFGDARLPVVRAPYIAVAVNVGDTMGVLNPHDRGDDGFCTGLLVVIGSWGIGCTNAISISVDVSSVDACEGSAVIVIVIETVESIMDWV